MTEPLYLFARRAGLARKRRFSGVCALLLLACSPALTWAAPGSTTADIMKLPLSPRALGMGEAFSAVGGGIDSLPVNPAGLTSMKSQELKAMHASLVAGMSQGEASYGIPTRWGSFAGEYMSFGSGSVDCYDANNNPCGAQTVQDQFFRAGYAKQIFDGVSVGGDFTYLGESLAGIRAETELVDLGARAQVFDPRFSVALSYKNLGRGLKFDNDVSATPQSVVFGLAWDQPIIKTLRVLVAADVLKPNDRSVDGHVGAELWLYDLLALRFGYVTEEDIGTGLRMGAGVRWKDIGVDYAMASEGELGSAHYVSVSLRFGKKTGAEATAPAAGGKP